MKRSFFQATAIVVAFGFVPPLFAQPARADDSTVLRCAPSFERCEHATTLPLHAGWVDGRPGRHIIVDASDVNEARKLGVVYSPYPANVGNGAAQHVAKLSARYVFEGGLDFSQQRWLEASTGGSSFVRVGGIEGALNAPILAPDRVRPYAQNGYSALLNMQLLPADNAPRMTDFAMFAAHGANPAGFLVNYPDVVQIIRL
jgi:hypothetical protein